jgi:hypothetical protein
MVKVNEAGSKGYTLPPSALPGAKKVNSTGNVLFVATLSV